MRSKIQKWGNSLAVRIPKSFAKASKIESGSPVELHLEEGRIVLVPVQQSDYELEDLLAQVTEENMHDEIDFGKALGREQW